MLNKLKESSNFLRTNRMSTIIIVMLFAIFTIFMTYPLWKTNQMVVTSDWTFHASRVEEIYRNLKHGQLFTFIATSTFHQTGVGSFLFYPTLFLYPWALLRFIFSPLTSFYVWYSVMSFGTLVVSYFSMVHITHSKSKGFIFALLYTLNPYRLYLAPSGFVLGEFIASTFVPLAFLGLYEILWGNKNEWYILGIAMALLLNSHILTVVLTVEIFVLILVFNFFFNYQKISDNIFGIVKAAILAGVLAFPALVPFITDFIGRGITSAYKGIGILNGADVMWSSSISNKAVGNSVGIISIVVIFVGWKFIEKKNILRYSYILGILLILLSTSVFPWMMFENTFLGIVQLPWRYLIYADLFLAIVASFIIDDGIKNFTNVYRSKIGIFIIIFGLAIVSYYGSISDVINRNVANNTPMVHKVNSNSMARIPEFIKINNSNYRDQFNYQVRYGETDYFPKKSLKYENQILQHKARIDGKFQTLKPTSSGDGILFKLNSRKIDKIDLPVVAYNGTQVQIDGKKIKSTISKRGTVLVIGTKNINNIKVTYEPNILYYVSVLISMIGWLLTGFLLIYKKYRVKQGFTIW